MFGTNCFGEVNTRALCLLMKVSSESGRNKAENEASHHFLERAKIVCISEVSILMCSLSVIGGDLSCIGGAFSGIGGAFSSIGGAFSGSDPFTEIATTSNVDLQFSYFTLKYPDLTVHRRSDIVAEESSIVIYASRYQQL